MIQINDEKQAMCVAVVHADGKREPRVATWVFGRAVYFCTACYEAYICIGIDQSSFSHYAQH